MLQSIDKKKKIFIYLTLLILLGTQISKNHDIEKKNLIKANHIEVFGLSEKNNMKITNRLKPFLFKNIFFLKKNFFYEILEENNLIESFYIQKIYPNRIKVNIEKTSFLALTSKDNKRFYIGANGKLISMNNSESFKKKLPFVFTKNNYNDFIDLKKTIDKSNFQFNEINSFYHFPSNRWDLKTKDGTLIKLPEKNILNALQLIYKIKSNQKIGDNKIIDLRISNHIITSNE
tara:strand:+ start:3611 stop:4306 length:696 start_codon:yes stop_codon:yes gene_type:complete